MNAKKMIYTGGTLLGLLLIGSVVEWRGSRAGATYSSPVTVMNTTQSPANVLSTESAARAPYQRTVQTTCLQEQVAEECFFSFPAPPAGHRLVIQNVSGALSLQLSATVQPSIGMLIISSSGGVTTNTVFAPTPAPIVDGGPSFKVSTFNQGLLAYVDSADTFYFFVNALHSNQGSYATVSGYEQDCSLVPCPAVVNN